jgi:mono/diheme cytochrome c family protein
MWRRRALLAGGIRMCLLVSALMAVANPAFAEEETIGSDEYRISCASCHGVGGRGDGKLAKFLTPKPSDLTVLARNNGGQYPFLKVFLMIDGRADVEVHGDRAMPVWGNRYRKEAAEEYGPFGGEEVVHGRMLELVYYIQSIQQ